MVLLQFFLVQLFLVASVSCWTWTPPPVAVDDKLVLWTCDNGASGRQQFDIGNSSSSPTAISIRGGSLVWDIIGPSNNTGTGIHAWGYYSDNRPNQQWKSSFTSPSTLSTIQSFWGKCLGIEGPAYFGSAIVEVDCNNDPTQMFMFNNITGTITIQAAPDANVTGGILCVDAGSVANCSFAPFNSYDYCNPDLAPSDRAIDLAQRLSIYDWQSLLQNSNVGVPRFGVPPISFNEALHGIVFGCGPTYTDSTGYTSSGCPTSFPHATLMGGAFNRSLWHSVASVISDEGRALHNSNGYALISWAPDINPFRDCRWGRGQEVASEDPFHISEYIYEYARGLQEGEDSRYIKLVSTAKHATGYDLENWNGNDRNSFTAKISLHDAVEYFWPPFESATQRGNVKSIMCSYNSVSLDGAGEIPSCAWKWFQMDVMHQEWNWNGFIVSDCGAIADINVGHHYVNNMSAAAAAGILAGTDVNCGGVYADGNFVNAVNEGLMTLSDIASSGLRFLNVVFATGLMDPPSRVSYNTYGPEKVDSLSSRKLALEAAIQGIALLANEKTSTPWGNGQYLLPLQEDALKGKTIAVIGPNSNSTALLSIYIGSNTVVSNQSVLQSLQRRGAFAGFTVTTSLGCSWTCTSTDGFAAASATASSADLIILVMGLYPGKGGTIPDGGPTQEDEGFDRTEITLPGNQAQLVSTIAAIGKPLVLLLIHGGPIALDTTALNLPAIVDAHYPGEMGGDAVTHVLFGDSSMAGSGRITTTIYPPEFVNQRNMSDYELAPHGNVPGITHMYYDPEEAQWPFGFGISYTNFTFQWLNTSFSSSDISVISASKLAKGDIPPFAVNVTNIGSFTSDITALAFVSTSIPGEPLQKLFDFERASAIQPGESRILSFTLPPQVASTVMPDGARILKANSKLYIKIGDVPRRSQNEQIGSRVYATLLLEDDENEVIVVTRALPPRY